MTLKDNQLAAGAKEVPLPPSAVANTQAAVNSHGFMARAGALARWVWSGQSPAEQFFGAGQPLAPMAPPEVEGRVRDFPMSANMQFAPRPEELLPFEELYSLADSCDLVRLCLETRIEQVRAQKWSIRLRESKDGKKFGDVQTELVRFFRKPDRRENWGPWIGRILEDLFVGDCPAIYVRRALDGSVFGFEPINGASIKLLLDPWGRTPLEGAAYQQILKGFPAVSYSRDQLIYSPRRPRNSKGYGLGIVEQIVITVNIALKRQLHQLTYYTQGSIPDLIVGVPLTWNEKAIERLATSWEALFRGNSAQRRGHPLIIPGGNESTFVNTKSDILKDEYDEWLARIICYAFSLPPTAFVKQMNRATAVSAQEQGMLEGLRPLQDWIKDLHDDMLERMGHPEAEFVWLDEEAADPLIRAQVHQIYLSARDADGNPVMTANEVRDRLSLDPLPPRPEPEPLPDPLEPAPGPPAPAPPGSDGPPTPDTSTRIPDKAPQDDPTKQDLKQSAISGEPLSSGSTVAGEQGDPGGMAPPPVTPVPEIRKAKQAFPPIDRQREAVKKAETKLKAIFTQKFSAIQKALHDQVMQRDATKLCKVEDSLDASMSPEAKKKLQEASIRSLSGLYKDGAAEGATQVGLSTGVGLGEVNKLALAWAVERAAKTITQIDETTQAGINALVVKSVEEGWSNAKLADAIQSDYAFSNARAELIARTESAMADSAGNMAAYKAAGITGKSWLCNSDSCLDCLGNEADGVIPFEDTFSSGDDAPPCHPLCVCVCVPAMLDSSE